MQYPDALPVMMGDLKQIRRFAGIIQKFEIDFDLLSAVDELADQASALSRRPPQGSGTRLSARSTGMSQLACLTAGGAADAASGGCGVCQWQEQPAAGQQPPVAAGLPQAAQRVPCPQVRLEFDFKREAEVMDAVADNLRARLLPPCSSASGAWDRERAVARAAAHHRHFTGP